jgi:hypothetical protein
MSVLRRALWLSAMALVLSGCVVRERVVVVRPAPPCPGAVWMEGHYGPRGRWHPGHWRCTEGVEVVEVE